MHFDTATNVVNDALLEMGMASSSDVYASTEAGVVQARALLKGLGRTLVRKYQWAALQKVHIFTTAAGTESYALPSDFGRLTPSTQWNQETEQRLLGPLQGQGWRVLNSSSAVNGITYWHRFYQRKVFLHPTPTAEEGLSYEYQSRFWVVPTGQTIPTSESPTANTDVLWLDSRLLVTGLKFAWRKAKRMDVSAELEEFKEALDHATGGDAFVPDLPLTGTNGIRLLDDGNVPETGFGS